MHGNSSRGSHVFMVFSKYIAFIKCLDRVKGVQGLAAQNGLRDPVNPLLPSRVGRGRGWVADFANSPGYRIFILDGLNEICYYQPMNSKHMLSTTTSTSTAMS